MTDLQDGAGLSAAFVALVQATAGAAGGVFATTVLMPLEVVKTRIQIRQVGDASTFGTVRQIASEDGICGLYQGLVAKCFETGCKNFVYFYIYDALNTIAKRHFKPATGVKLTLGYLAGVVNVSVNMPLEVLSTRLQTEPAGTSCFALAASILKREGLAGFFKGYGYNIFLCVNPAIQNTTFDKLKAWVLRAQGAAKRNQRAALTPVQAFILGAVAKALAAIATFPLTRLKTILQAGSKPGQAKVANVDEPRKMEKPPSTPAMMRAMGIRLDVEPEEQTPLQRFAQLYRGLGSTLWKSVLQAALLYMTKDQVEGIVVKIFHISASMMRRKDGQLKLGAWSGRPLAS